ncbi:hypothetical protein [Stutzerimonas nitrititolerans]|uniref:hypothetical protein n=1 Tax=Stutzerimonas nitrititolerans TaxID=2482751 RepID=UPI0028990C68|nr:hypothetical protein [Stutzerimonas nitrititolerans]
MNLRHGEGAGSAAVRREGNSKTSAFHMSVFKKMTPFSAVAQRVEGLRLSILALAKRHVLIAH